MFHLLKKKAFLAPADENFFRFPSNILKQFQSDDIFLTSFPRSGNTWMRHLISGSLQKKPNHLIPDLHVPGFRDVPRQSDEGALLYKSHTICDLENFKHIYLFRNAEDSLVSYAHFAGRSAGGCDNFVCRSIRTWAYQIQAVQSMASAYPEKWFLLSYETLLKQTKESLQAVFEWLKIERTGLQIDQSIEDARKVPKINKGVGQYIAAGSGKGKQQLESYTLELIEEHAKPAYLEILKMESLKKN